MIKLRKALGSYLKTIHPRVFFQSSSTPQFYPYLVFDVSPIIDDGEGGQMATVDVDGWDVNPDTTALEALMAAVSGNGSPLQPSGLNKRSLSFEEAYFTFYLDTTLTLTDTDSKIRRRKQTYQVHIYERS